MTPQTCLTQVIKPALNELPPEMRGKRAEAMILAIMLQESELAHRRQMGNGPARGLGQFERGGGVRGVLRFGGKVSSEAFRALTRRGIQTTEQAAWEALEKDDQLAAIFCRLLLWSDWRALPESDKPDDGWAIYNGVWRPGKPHPNKWPGNFRSAWQCVAQY